MLMEDYFFGASKQKTVNQVYCPRCGENHIGYLEQRGPHIGLFCTVCAGWIKWLSAAEKKQINLERAQKDFEGPVHSEQHVKDTGPAIDHGEDNDDEIIYDDREFDVPW